MPVLAIVVVASLAVGIGVNTAVFSWVQAMILQPLPGVPDTGRMHLVEPRTESGSYPGASWLEYRDLRDFDSSRLQPGDWALWAPCRHGPYEIPPLESISVPFPEPPGPGHPLGTDNAGRDTLARLIGIGHSAVRV